MVIDIDYRRQVRGGVTWAILFGVICSSSPYLGIGRTAILEGFAAEAEIEKRRVLLDSAPSQ